jgi:hypothetical protein
VGRRPLVAAGIGVGAALLVAALWWRRPRTPVVESALEGTVSVRISRHDALGFASKPVVVRDPKRVRALVEALGVDAHGPIACPDDYATAEVGLLLSGRDVYARRNVYVWAVLGDGGAGVRPSVVMSSSAGCRGGEPANAQRLRELLLLRDVAPP